MCEPISTKYLLFILMTFLYSLFIKVSNSFDYHKPLHTPRLPWEYWSRWVGAIAVPFLRMAFYLQGKCERNKVFKFIFF